MAFLQVVTNIPFALKHRFPHPLQNTASSLSWVNLSFFGSLGLSCHFPLDYVSQLILTTVTPICISIMLLLAGYIQEKVSSILINSLPVLFTYCFYISTDLYR